MRRAVAAVDLRVERRALFDAPQPEREPEAGAVVAGVCGIRQLEALGRSQRLGHFERARLLTARRPLLPKATLTMPPSNEGTKEFSAVCVEFWLFGSV